MPEAPALYDVFLRVRVRGDLVETEGRTEASLGHRIPIPGREEPAGTWLRWTWDGQQLSVTRDRFGAYPLFYATTDDSIVLSPSIGRILDSGVSRELDLDALSAFAAIGYYLGADTPFLTIRSLPSGASLTWRPGRLEVRGSPPPFNERPIESEAVIEGIIETVRTAVARCMPSGERSDYVMPISGGRDSRHLLLELRRQGYPPRLCLTAGHYPSIGGGQDAKRAAALCAGLGIEHRRVEVQPSLVEAEMRKNEITGYLSDEHSWSLPLADAMAGQTDHTYYGLAGGTLIKRSWENFGWESLGHERRFDELAGRIVLGADGRDRFSDLISPRLRDSLDLERATARVRTALEAYESASNPTLEFRFWNRDMRELNLVPSHILSAVPTIYEPYLDPDFVDFMGSVPSGMLNRAVQDKVIATAFPEVAEVRYARFRGPAVDGSIARRIGRDLARILLRESDGSIVDRGRLLRQAARSSVTGETGLAIGRRPSLITYLVQLERVVREGPRPVS